MTKLNPNDKAMSIRDFISALQTLFHIDSETVFNIGKRARELGAFNDSKTYSQWLRDLAINIKGACPICKLPQHLGQCGETDVS